MKKKSTLTPAQREAKRERDRRYKAKKRAMLQTAKKAKPAKVAAKARAAKCRKENRLEPEERLLRAIFGKTVPVDIVMHHVNRILRDVFLLLREFTPGIKGIKITSEKIDKPVKKAKSKGKTK